MVCVVDYELCNVGSVVNMLKKLGAPAIASGKSEDIESAEKVILPGVGSYDAAMAQIDRMNLKGALNRVALESEKPVLGICLGMHLMGDSSEEGSASGLGWIPGKVVRFDFSDGPKKKIPHMGWNFCESRSDALLFQDFESQARFYFVHSYHYQCQDQYVQATTNYGMNFPSAIRSKNIFGAQFHPEKSHKYGLRFLKNFLEFQ